MSLSFHPNREVSPGDHVLLTNSESPLCGYTGQVTRVFEDWTPFEDECIRVIVDIETREISVNQIHLRRISLLERIALETW